MYLLARDLVRARMARLSDNDCKDFFSRLEHNQYNQWMGYMYMLLTATDKGVIGGGRLCAWKEGG